jgi:hypothetical protein
MAARRHCLLPLIGMLIMLSGLNCGAADTAAFAQA